MKSHILFAQLSILIASYAYCVLPPHLLEDHCYKLDAEESFFQKNITPTSISEICFHKDRKLYEVGSYNFVAWQVTITAMAVAKVNFRLMFSENSTLLVTCKFAKIEDASDFHREIYHDRLYDVPDELQQPDEWRQLPASIIESVTSPFKLQKSDEIVAVAMVQKRENESDPFFPPSIIAKSTEQVELVYESYKQCDGQTGKIFTITVVDATNVKKPLVTFDPQGFELVDKSLCGDFIVILIFDLFYVISLETQSLAENLFNTLEGMTQCMINNCPSEVDVYVRFLEQHMHKYVSIPVPYIGDHSHHERAQRLEPYRPTSEPRPRNSQNYVYVPKQNK